MLKDDEKKRIIERYDARFAQFGYDIRTLASGTAERHRLRHRILTEIGVREGCTLLDLGCGFGDYFGYLQSVGCNVDYVGYDINPKLVQMAARQHPEATFQVKDVLSEPFPTFDFVVASNVLNLRLQEQDNYALLDEMMRVCYQHARRGVAVDFLTSYVDFQTPEAFHYEPEQVFAMAKRITKRVTLRHDYPLYEFCIYLYPDFSGWRGEDGAR